MKFIYYILFFIFNFSLADVTYNNALLGETWPRIDQTIRQKSYYGPNLALVFFYRSSKLDNLSIEEKEKFTNMVKDFYAAGEQQPYVHFKKVDLDKNTAFNWEQKLNIKTTPAFMLFKDDKPYTENNGENILYGYLTKSKMLGFIAKYFTEFIEEIKEKIESENKAFYIGEEPRLYYDRPMVDFEDSYLPRPRNFPRYTPDFYKRRRPEFHHGFII